MRGSSAVPHSQHRHRRAVVATRVRWLLRWRWRRIMWLMVEQRPQSGRRQADRRIAGGGCPNLGLHWTSQNCVLFVLEDLEEAVGNRKPGRGHRRRRRGEGGCRSWIYTASMHRNKLRARDGRWRGDFFTVYEEKRKRKKRVVRCQCGSLT